MNPIRVLIADDHAVSRAGLATLIETAGDMAVVAQAADGHEAVVRFRETSPDVSLMDLGMPGLGGIEATAAICAEFPRARIVALTAFEGDEDIHRALEAGARGYLLKSVSRDELLEVVRAVHAGQRCIAPEVAARLAERVCASTGLTPRELEVLGEIARGRSNAEIASALGVSESSVKAYANRVFDKLGVSDRTQAAVTALRRGIVHLD